MAFLFQQGHPEVQEVKTVCQLGQTVRGWSSFFLLYVFQQFSFFFIVVVVGIFRQSATILIITVSMAGNQWLEGWDT